MLGYDLSKEDAWVKKKDPYYKSSIYDQQLFGCATENYFNKNPDAWYGVQWSIALKPEKGPGLISYKKIDNKYYSKGKLVEQHTVKRPIIVFIIEIALKAENPETNDEINTSGKENVGNFNVTKALRVTKISEIGTQMPPETLINLAKAADNIDYGANNELSFTINSVRSQSGINLNHAFFKIMPDTEDHEGITC